MATLITGAGLVGSHAARILQDLGERVVLTDVNPNKAVLMRLLDPRSTVIIRSDLIDLPEILRAIKENQVNRIIHTASLTSDVWEHPYRGVRANIEAFANIYEAARLMAIERVTISSSMAVYAAGNPHEPEDPGGPIKETSTLRPGDVYGTTKLTGECLGLNYHYIYGVGFTAVRYPVVIPSRTDAFHYIPNTDILRVGGTIPAMVKAALTGQSLTVKEWGALEWGYVKDIATGTVLANRVEPVPSKIFNLGVGQTISLSDVAAIIRELIPGADVTVVDNPAARRRYQHDISRAKAELGYSPKYDMRRAIEEIIENSKNG